MSCQHAPEPAAARHFYACPELRWPGNEFFIGAECGGNVMCPRPPGADPLLVRGVAAAPNTFYGFPKGYYMTPEQKRQFRWCRTGPRQLG